jgi:hypothetical protein
MPGVGGSEPGSTATTQATVEAAEVETFVRDAGRANVKKSREVEEAPPEAGKEAAQPESQPAREEPQPQQDQPTECNTPGVCYPLSSGFELKDDRLSGDEDVKVKPMEMSPNLNLDVAPLLYL